MPVPLLVLKLSLAFLVGLALGRPLAAAAHRFVAHRGSGVDAPADADQWEPPLPTIRVVTAVVFTVVAARFEPWWQLGPYLALAAVLLLLSIVDSVTHRLPNTVVWPSLVVGLLTVGALAGLQVGAGRVGAALVGAALFAGIIGAAHIAHPNGMGRGDVKLAALLGLAIGWSQTTLVAAVMLVVDALVASSFLGLVHALRVGAPRDRSRQLPFGPALAAGSLVVIIVGPHLIR